jgi:putative peptidoglycan lipid II flippase
VAHLAYARRLVLVPVAVVGQAVGAAALPTLARLHVEGRDSELSHLVGQTVRASLAFALLAAAAFMVFAAPLVSIVYQRGAFGPHDTEVVAGILRISCMAVPFWVLQQVAVRAFYARGDTLRPMLLSSAITLAAIPLYLHLGKSDGARGIALAGVLGIGANALATLALGRRLHGAPSLRAMGASGARGFVVAGCASAAAMAVSVLPGFRSALKTLGADSSNPLSAATLLMLAAEAAAFILCALLAIRLFGDRLLRDTTQRLVTRAFRHRHRP